MVASVLLCASNVVQMHGRAICKRQVGALIPAHSNNLTVQGLFYLIFFPYFTFLNIFAVFFSGESYFLPVYQLLFFAKCSLAIGLKLVSNVGLLFTNSDLV